MKKFFQSIIDLFKKRKPIDYTIFSFQVKRATYNAWHKENPVLLDGEIGYDKTNNKIKIGNGVNTWSQLSYVK